MIIPVTINVLGTDVKIQIVTQDFINAKEAKENTGSTTLAFFESSENTIYLSENLDDENLRRTFLHELNHAVLSISGQTNYLKDKQEEALCYLAESWIHFFNNKELLEFLSNEYYRSS